MTRSYARQIALDYVKAMEARAGLEFVLLDEQTIEREFGWVFFYQSEDYVLFKRDSARLFGNAPIIVNRRTGRATLTDTSFPIDDLIAAYEALGVERFELGEWRTYLRHKVPPLD